MIRARVASDDGVRSAEFDATTWFERATDEQLREVSEVGFGGHYPADAVARSVATTDENVAEVLDYAELGDIGFECYINADDAREWLHQHRPALGLSD